MSGATLVLPLRMTTPRDSFCLSAWNYRQLPYSLLTIFVAGLKVVLNPGPFDKGWSDLTSQPPPFLYLSSLDELELSLRLEYFMPQPILYLVIEYAE